MLKMGTGNWPARPRGYPLRGRGVRPSVDGIYRIFSQDLFQEETIAEARDRKARLESGLETWIEAYNLCADDGDKFPTV